MTTDEKIKTVLRALGRLSLEAIADETDMDKGILAGFIGRLVGCE